MTSHSLFRPEVLVERQSQWLGTVLLTPRVSFRLFTAFAALTTVAVLGLLFFGEYTRKARIHGWLAPHQGLVRVFAPQAGVVTELYVKEGEIVRQGQGLFALSAELQSARLGATQSEIARRLAARRDSLEEDRRQRTRLTDQQLQSLTERLAAVRAEQAQLGQEITTQTSRMRLAQQAEARQRELLQRGFISAQQMQDAQAVRLEQDAKLRALERSRLTLQREQLTVESELRDLPFKSQAEIANIERNIATVEQELAETEARRAIIIPAPEAGAVTAIQIERGGRADSAIPLLSIIPVGAELEAHLFSPSRAIGFLQPGQPVLLRYQAYPYQKFGHYQGTVAHLSRAAINPGELPMQLAGLTSLFGANEPIYRVTVNLARQTVTAYGQSIPLQPGMQLEADVLIERRTLIEWVLDPLFTLTGK